MHAQSVGQCHPPSAEFRQWERMLQLLIPLYGHDSLRSEESYRLDIARASRTDPARLVASLARWADVSEIRSFAKQGEKFSRMRLERRTRDALILTDNVFTSGFRPPSATRVATAFSTLIRFSHSNGIGSSDYQRALSSALSFYLVFLTIHPFLDGNGRTARFFFAASVGRLGACAPLLLLALALMHRHRGAMFHFCAKIARIGTFDAFATLFDESLLLCEAMFQGEIDIISQTPTCVAISGTEMSALMSIRSKLSTCIRT